MVRGEDLTVAANSQSTTAIAIPAVTGYSFVGVVGFNVPSAAVTTRQVYSSDGSAVGMAIRNHSSASVTVAAAVYCLYAKSAMLA